ncbi:hypothetical protein J3F84DRAFT_379440 [Trichoderma pleuroticola]
MAQVCDQFPNDRSRQGMRFLAILCLQVMSIMQVVVLGAYRLPYGWISALESCVSIVAIAFLWWGSLMDGIVCRQ